MALPAGFGETMGYTHGAEVRSAHGAKLTAHGVPLLIILQGSLRIIGFAKASKKKSATSVVIPAAIKVDGITYKVTEIGANAFKGMPKLKTVTIGANVTKIGKGAFRDSAKLKTVTIKTKTLKSVGANAFKSIKTKAVFKLSFKKMDKKAKAALILKYKKLVKKGKAPSSTKVK